MSAIVAATSNAVREQLAHEVSAAALEIGAVVASAAELAGSLQDQDRQWVVTGLDTHSAQAFVHVARAADRPVLALLPGSEWPEHWQRYRHPPLALLEPGGQAASVRAAWSAMQAGLSVWRLEPGHEASDPAPSPGALSAREREVLALVAAGLATKAAARQLGVSPNTVKFHLRAAFDKLGVNTRAEAVLSAIRRGELAV
jgi:DNA-binding CsgD family transcriptional regulator